MNTIEMRAFDWSLYPSVLSFIAEGGKSDQFVGWRHTGDVRHFLSNMLRGTDPSRHLYVHEIDGEIAAVVLIYPARLHGFDVMIQPRWRTPAREAGLIAWAVERTWALLRESGIEKDHVVTDVTDGDTARQAALNAAGFTIGDVYLTQSWQSLDGVIPEPTLPEGFRILSAAHVDMSEDDLVVALGKVHSSAFKSNWGERQYLTVMQSPAFDLQNEIVVVAPNGDLAAFCILWFDPTTQTGLFEPVGCAEAYQRRGLTKALMIDGLRRMQAAGCTQALVTHETQAENPASWRLYTSLGFKPMCTIRESKRGKGEPLP